MEILRHLPAPARAARELHDRLAEAGQTLRDTEMPSFLLSVSAENGELIGGCKGEIAFASMHVSELWVSESLRGRGVGSALLAEAERLARDEGCRRIHLETRNETARRLYERIGYRVFGTLPEYDGPQAFYHLEKSLREPSADAHATASASDVRHLELRREPDGSVYRFDRRRLDGGGHGYKRRDADLWILWRSDLGWVAIDPSTGGVSGRPWSVMPAEQSADAPPEGEWVSKKGKKSYVYELVHGRR